MKVYGKEFKLVSPLDKVECWNYSDNKTSDFQVGETIQVVSVYDATRTIIRCSEEDGRPVVNADGTPYAHEGYRYIVNNEALGNAIGVKMPKKTSDLIGDLIAYESGEADEKTTKRLFRTLKKTGIGRKLQGHYSSRM